MGRQRARVVVQSLDAHPNRAEITGILARLPHIPDPDVQRMAAAWANPPEIAEARQHALQPTSPLVIDALAAFDLAQALFAEDLVGGHDYLTVEPGTVVLALKAIRDAIAGSFARPVLGGEQHAALLGPWRLVYPDTGPAASDFGERGADIDRLIAGLDQLAPRCHDPLAAADHATLVAACEALDEGVHGVARDEAWRIAVLTSRRRLWYAVRRRGTEGFTRRCPVCRTRPSKDVDPALALALDAACGLLVADALDETLVDVLTVPLQDLVPLQRPATES
ncbi:MAG TPA: hypothetical protein VG708_09615 [Mycobacteriales bacterium]|jgi:hypothetical protein|nr:hypothetical protein [Mycobacteriales bacterium]